AHREPPQRGPLDTHAPPRWRRHVLTRQQWAHRRAARAGQVVRRGAQAVFGARPL
ncbi:hypothetical protein MNEG_15238, partial [Monoraphidium neglectum]